MARVGRERCLAYPWSGEPMIEGAGIRRVQIRTLVIVAAAAFGLYLGYRLAVPFLPALTWAGRVSAREAAPPVALQRFSP